MRQQEKIASIVLGASVLILVAAIGFNLNKGKTPQGAADKAGAAPRGGRGQGQLTEPRGVVVDAKGFVYVVDSGNNRIQKFSPAGECVKEWGSEGQGEGQFKTPGGIDLGQDGSVYVADTWNHRVEKFDANGKFLKAWGGEGGFWGPRDVAVDAKGFVYVTDTGNRRIQKFTADGQFVKMWGKKGAGPDDYDEPFGIKVGADGLLYICDRLNFRIVVCSPEGKTVRSWPINGWQKEQFYMEPYLALDDRRDRVYVTDPTKHRVHAFDLKGKFIGALDNDPSTHMAFTTPLGVAVNKQTGLLVVTDMTANKFYKFDSKSAPFAALPTVADKKTEGGN